MREKRVGEIYEIVDRLFDPLTSSVNNVTTVVLVVSFTARLVDG
jgi:hypothetical protein